MSRGVVVASSWGAAVGCFLAGAFPLFNADGFGHLAQGRQIAALGRVPTVDPFSFWKTDPQPWTNYEWAYDAVSWWIYDWLGATGLVLAKCIALAFLGWALVRIAVRLAGSGEAAPWALAATLVALPIARVRFTVRPQIVGLVFPALLLLCVGALYSDATPRRKTVIVLAVTALQVVWVNAHGSHLLGLLITALFLAFAFRTPAFRWMAMLLTLQLVATGCTPFGYAIVGDAMAHITRPEFQTTVTEWAPWSPRDPLRLLLGPSAFALGVVLVLRRVTRTRFGLAYAAWSVVLCVMAFRSTRFVAHQVLFTAPFIAAGLSTMASLRSGRAWIPAVGAAAVVSALWTTQLVPSFGFGFGEDRRDYPWSSAEQIETHVEGARVVATIQDSWPMMFAAPAARFLVDGRVPFYGPEFVSRVTQSFANPSSFAELLDEFGVNVVVVDHTRADHLPATEWLVRHDEWELVHVEDGHSLFVHRDATSSLPTLRIVGPGYTIGAILDPEQLDDAVEAEVLRLAPEGSAGALAGWLRGLESLRPLARASGVAGLRPAGTEDEKTRAADAYRHLSTSAATFPGFTTIELYRALAALSICHVEEARVALARARFGGDTRETALAQIELSLRAGDPDQRRAASEELARLGKDPVAGNDPWVRALLSADLPPCGP